MQKIILYLRADSVKATVVDKFNQGAAVPAIARGMAAAMAMRLVDSDGVKYDPALLDFVAWDFVLENDWDITTPVKLRADSVVLNVTADYTEVEAVFNNTNTDALIAALGDSESISLGAELVGIRAGETLPAFILQFDGVNIRNRRSEAGTGSPVTMPDNYLTAQQTVALLKEAPSYQYSVDGSTLWHDTQVDADRYYRERRNEGEWSDAIKMIVGPQGENGTQGVDGAGLTPRGAYSAGTTYAIRDLVSYLGSSWISLSNSNIGHTPSEGAYWTLSAEKGEDGSIGVDGDPGANGIGYVPKGAWSGATTYALDESVTYQGSLYASLQDSNLNQNPATETAYWLKIVSKGDAGSNGSNGTNGTNGADGKTWYSGAGAPSDANGVDGDYYLNTTSYDVFKKASGTWGTAALNIKGATGAAGSKGTNGTNGSDGATGTISSNTGVIIGDTTDIDYDITINNGDANPPKLHWNHTTNKWQYSNDGTTFTDIGSGGSGTDSNAIHVNASGEIAALTEKTTPVAADLVIIENSQASNAKKKVQLGNIPARTGVYRNEKFAAGIMIPRVTGGATFGQAEKGTNKNNYDYFEFNAATAQYVQFVWRAPDVWDLSTIKVKLHWTDGATAGTGNVVWGVQAVAISDGDALDVAFGTAQEVTDAFGSTGNNHVTAATSALTVGGTPALGDLVLIQIYRKAADAGDTYTQAARLLAIDIQYKESTTIPTIW